MFVSAVQSMIHYLKTGERKKTDRGSRATKKSRLQTILGSFLCRAGVENAKDNLRKSNPLLTAVWVIVPI